MVLKQWTNAVIGVIDKKLERFDPKWQAANGKGGLRSRYEDKTGIARHREWRGVKDTFVDYTAWLNNLLAMGKMVASAPVPILKGFWEYRWMGSYLGTFAFIDRLFEGYREDELKIAHMNMHCIVSSLTKKIALVLANDKRLGGGRDSDNIVPMDEVMPPLFMTGFPGLIPIPIQTLPEFIICDIDQHLEPYYIDVAESFGLAADVCSRCSAETGVAIDDDFPIVGRAVLTTNMPCNASEATSMFQRRRFGLPDFPVTMAMIHNEPAAHPYSAQVLRDCIDFVEKEYGVEYDWNALFKRAKHMNEQNRLELEKWDYFKTPYCPLTGISETLYRLYAWASANGQEDYFTKNDRKVIKILRKCYKNKYVPYGGTTRHRAFLWGPSAVYYTDFPTWTQNCWGINILVEMESLNFTKPLETEDKEEALRDLARLYERMVMRRHTNGGYQNVVDELWRQCEAWNTNIIIMYQNVACKNMATVQGILDEQGRERGYHMIWIEHDLMDPRTVSRKTMRDKVNEYMRTVMRAEPIDPSLCDFDDENCM